MNWDAIRTGFNDELQKIAAVSLQGLSPETVLRGSEPLPPFPSAGFDKARAILDRAQMMKVSRVLGANPGMPGIQHFADEEKKDPSVAGQAKSFAGHTIAGAGAGRLVGFAAHGPTGPISNAAKQSLHAKQWYGTVAGAAVGAGTYAVRKMRERAARGAALQKVSNIVSPGQALKATQQVAKHPAGPRLTGPSVRTQIRGSLVGNRGLAPTGATP